jgi:predicted permease
MTTLIQDVRYAIRQFRKSPGFTTIAVISLALAIGANTTIFSFANQMLYVRLGVPHPEQLRMLTIVGDKHVAIRSTWGNSSFQDGTFHTSSFSYPIYRQLREQQQVLQPIVAFKSLSSANITANGVPQAAEAELVSGNFYTQMQVQPELGRPILPSDDAAPGTGAVAILSDAFWHRAFGGSPSVLGKTLTVNMTPVTIIGVNPPQFTGPDGVQTTSPEVFLPLSMISVLHPATGNDDPLGPNLWWVELMARTKSGVSDTQSQAALNVILNTAVRATMFADTDLPKGATIPHLVLENGSRGDTSSLREFVQPLHALLGLAALVLLLACANIANLMLARATSRQREMSVRMALGAARWRILRQVLAESLLLAGLSGVAGLFLGYLGRNLIPWLTSFSWQGGELTVSFDGRVFGFTSAITLLTGILFGIAPAWRSTHAEVNTTLKEGGRTASRQRKAWSGKVIVGFQVALSTVLVMSAVLFLRTLINLNSIDPGFRPQNLLLFDINPPASRYPPPKDVALQHHLEDAFAALPGVQGVTLSDVPLVAGSMSSSTFLIEGAKEEASGYLGNHRDTADMADVGSQFFSVMSIPILAGRAFTAQDTENSPRVSVINNAFARRFLPNINPIGKRFRVSTEGPDASRWFEIIGICADPRYQNMREPPPPLHFDLYRQMPEIDGVTFIIRSSLPPSSLIPSLRRAAQQIDPDLPLTTIRTQQQQIDASMQQERMFASLTAGFGILALALACVGIYGIMAYTVSQRTNEIGIRLALGAARERIRSMVLRETAWLAIAGVIIGLAATLALARLIQSMLYGLKPTDPITLGCGTVLLLVVALIAGWVPSYRASQVNPIDALRSE